jgi:uncharacterized repeat protein (TIGR01451 family)
VVALLALGSAPAAATGVPVAPVLQCVLLGDQRPVVTDPATLELRKLPLCKVQLSLDKDVSNSTPMPGDVVQWTITVRNVGRIVAPDVVVKDVLPAGNLFVAEHHTGGSSYDAGTGLWHVGSLLPGHGATLVISAIVGPAAATNCATAVALAPRLTREHEGPSIIDHLGDLIEVGDIERACATETPPQPTPGPSATPPGTVPTPLPTATPVVTTVSAPSTVGLPNTGRAAA